METVSLKDKVAIVTGASKGIGKAIALELAKKGASIVLASRNFELLTEVKNEIINSGGTAVAIPTDVTLEHSVKNLVYETKNLFGKIDILINN